MTTLTVKVSGKKQALLLYEMLSALRFVKKIDMDQERSSNQSEKEILNERLQEHNINPKSGRTLDDLVVKISRRHGFKNHN